MITATGVVTFDFTHRYNFESSFDGGQLQFRVNGGAFTTVPDTSFTANGYTGTASGLGNELGFTGQSTGNPAFITSSGSLGSLTAGDNLQVQFLASWDLSVVEASPNWEIQSLTVTPVPFEFSPTLGMGILGGAWLVRNKLKKK